MHLNRFRYDSRRSRLLGLAIAVLIPTWIVTESAAQSPPPPLSGSRGIAVQAINNNPASLVRVSVDRKDCTYAVGDELIATVRSERDGYLYLVYIDAEDRAAVIFPNQIQQTNQIKANTDVMVPSPDAPKDARFRLRITKPTGREVLKAIVTTEPLTDKELQVEALTKSVATVVGGNLLKGVLVERLGGENTDQSFAENRDKLRQADEKKYQQRAKEWSEHHVIITTVDKNAPPPAAKQRRVGLFIGISKYKSGQIRQLKVADQDAQQFADIMKSSGKLDHAIVLTNQQATLKGIEDAIRNQLPANTAPGDTVLVYWSGHGARCADDNGDEPDGYDEYLVPHDGELSDINSIRQSMLLDDTFGRWFQELDGRQLVFILDTCHSGGAGQLNAKGIGDAKPGAKAFDFLDGEINRVRGLYSKDLQGSIVMLASSKATEQSFERKEGDLSAMTYYLIDLLKTTQGPVTMSQAFQHVAEKVPAYVKKEFPGASQTPIVVPDAIPAVFLRP